MAEQCKVIVHQPPCFAALLFLLTANSTLEFPCLTLICSFSLSPNLLPLPIPESDRSLRSSWRQSLCPPWSRSRPLPSCPKVCLSVCLSGTAVALVCHLSVKSPLMILKPHAYSWTSLMMLLHRNYPKPSLLLCHFCGAMVRDMYACKGHTDIADGCLLLSPLKPACHLCSILQCQMFTLLSFYNIHIAKWVEN